jgi:membrane protein required for colicin V production
VTFLSDSCELSIIAAFRRRVFALGLVVMSLFTPLFSSAVQRSVLGGLDQGLGFLFGVVRGVLLVAVAFIVYDRAVASRYGADGRQLALGQESLPTFRTDLNKTVPEDAPGWIVDRYDRADRNLRPPPTG